MLVPDQLPPAGVAVSVTGIGWLHKFWSAPALTVGKGKIVTATTA